MSDKPENSEMGKTFTSRVRILEAVCRIDFPTPDEQNFRVAIMKDIGRELNLQEVRLMEIRGQGQGIKRPANPGVKGPS